ncbi:hypothetical protein PFICI_02144 [Pestalotiopsis fici W106-1]|uniref:FAD-binding PCMH-type domain-containing protein n=1 Tax=Pestalotiopsis fici (strain W106-1 / CGMCC3.15140) TaxID=1229662 RepID=W3XDM2_PESFW|nr:uncharacterized protein PFICI_02144 [Pestalotiopsis fici W106-1]ETS84119.1 hypothetical protein PFICI_02144 [Pestalotiopsis fici W106-1]
MTITGLSSLHCEHFIPSAETPALGFTRWSDTNIDRPSLVVIPENEADVQAAMGLARTNHLIIVTGGGGHGTYVPVGPKNLYLDMRKFQTILLDKARCTVRIGGGVVTGDLLKSLALDGYYTALPNSNAVGVVGCVLGAGSTPLNGLHGVMADMVQSFRIVVSEDSVIEVKASSTGEHLSLFNALCGAGHGLGVVTAITTSAYPISSLNMTDDKICIRSLMFPPTSIETAVRAFLDLSRPSPKVSNTLTFLRIPVSGSANGVPVIAIGSTCFGSLRDAKDESSALYSERFVEVSSKAGTDMVPMEHLNDRFEPQNKHGGHKAIASCRLKAIDVETITTAFESWLSVTERVPGAWRSIVAISRFNSTRHKELGAGIGGDRFIESRDRDFSAMTIVMCNDAAGLDAMTDYMTNFVRMMRAGDASSTPRSFPNNLRFGIDLEEMFDKHKLAELRRIKHIWDPQGIFWSPFMSDPA